MKNKKLNKTLTGVSGEDLVAAELSRRGYVASLTLRNTRGIDILVSNVDATKSVGVQVKTNSGSKPHWLLSQKAEKDVAENLFYIFVTLNGLAAPDFYIVSRRWISRPGRRRT